MKQISAGQAIMASWERTKWGSLKQDKTHAKTHTWKKETSKLNFNKKSEPEKKTGNNTQNYAKQKFGTGRLWR